MNNQPPNSNGASAAASALPSREWHECSQRIETELLQQFTPSLPDGAAARDRRSDSCAICASWAKKRSPMKPVSIACSSVLRMSPVRERAMLFCGAPLPAFGAGVSVRSLIAVFGHGLGSLSLPPV